MNSFPNPENTPKTPVSPDAIPAQTSPHANLTTILFDNDGVLVDTEILYFQASREILATIDIDLSHDQFVDLSLTQGASVFQLAANKGLTHDHIESLRTRRNERYSHLLHDVADSHVLPGVRETLTTLARHFRMGIVTGSRRDHFDIIHANSSLLPFFDFFITTEDYPREKPHPEPYLMGIEKAGVPAHQCIVIEDSQRGLASAVAAGLPCIMIRTPMSADQSFDSATHVVDSIYDIPPLLISETVTD